MQLVKVRGKHHSFACQVCWQSVVHDEHEHALRLSSRTPRHSQFLHFTPSHFNDPCKSRTSPPQQLNMYEQMRVQTAPVTVQMTQGRFILDYITRYVSHKQQTASRNMKLGRTQSFSLQKSIRRQTKTLSLYTERPCNSNKSSLLAKLLN